MRPVLVLVSSAVLLGLLAAPAAGQVTLTTPGAPSKVASYGGVTAYSERDPATGRYRLMYDTNTDGAAQVVPVAPRSVPFDVDLGPGRDGRVLAAYSRCVQEPDVRRSGGPLPVWTTGRGCDIYTYDFREARETRLPGASTSQASEMLPSVWRGEVAFTRVYEERPGRRGVYPYIYVRALRAGATSRRQPGGARGEAGVPGPMSLDLVGDRLAFSWVYERPRGGVSEVRLDTVDVAHQKLDGEGWERSVLRFLTPHVADGRVFYGEQRSVRRDGAGTRSLGSWLWRYRISTGALSRADAPAQMYAGVHDRRALLTVFGTTDAFLSTDGCGPAGCRLFRAAERPRFSFMRTVPTGVRSCGDVTYTPQTDDGAFDIRARGTSCATARAIARDAEDRPTPFTSRGFRCTGELRTNGLTRRAITCRDGDRRVTFSRS